MGENNGHFTLSGKPAFLQLAVSMMIMLIAGPLLFYALARTCTAILHVSWADLAGTLSGGTSENNLTSLRIMMFAQDTGLFILPGSLILILMRQPGRSNQSVVKLVHFTDVILVVILGFCLFPITSFTGQINSEMHFPDWLSGIEKWMISEEDKAGNIINSLILSPAPGVLMLNIFLIAILPAIGEEIIFRGVFQRIFCNLFRSDNIAIWFTAFLFSALHFQFFGFLPRLILGLVFGYLYLWSGTLWLPVISHFVNNVVPVIAAFVQGAEKFNTPVNLPLWNQAIYLPLPLAVCLIVLIHFKRRGRIE